MQIVQTSDGIVIYDPISEDDNETKNNFNEINDIARINPSKEILLSDDPPYLVNSEEILRYLSDDSPYDNINVSAKFWNNLLPANFKKIRKSLLKEELGNIIGTGEDTIERAEEAIKVLSPRGSQNISVDKENGKEIIVGEVDSKKCIIDVSYGRTNSTNEENVLYNDQVNQNLRITISIKNNDKFDKDKLSRLYGDYYIPKDLNSEKYEKDAKFVKQQVDIIGNSNNFNGDENYREFLIPPIELVDALYSLVNGNFWFEDHGKLKVYYDTRAVGEPVTSAQIASLIPIYYIK